MRVLVVEDEPKMAALLRRGLREEGLHTDVVTTGQEALWQAGEGSYELIVLDVMLPDADGFEICRGLRERGIWSPVLMLTARDAVEDRVHGLDAGADDYLVKPFAFDELLARTRALTRRVVEPRPVQVEVGDLRLDPAARRVWRGDAEILVTPLEFALLEALMRSPGQVLPRRRLLALGWETDEQRSNVLDVAITGLRNKIDKPFERRSVETVRGLGYRMRGDGG
ncbi:MAG: response regulator transcription factor [Nocardioidaceae bacterium]